VSPELDPLVLWLNGGPGCSSLGGGWLSELGPYYPTSTGALKPNPHTWVKGANVIFLESPAGVGFSYFNNSDDLYCDDARTAADTRLFLLGWLEKFPGFSGSPLVIAGESYAGHYAPQLAAAILDGNQGKAQGAPGYLNLEGMAIGNAWTDPNLDTLGVMQHWLGHSHISTKTYDAVLANCNFTSGEGPVRAMYGRKLGGGARTRACDDASDDANFEAGLNRGAQTPVDIYDLFDDRPTFDYTCGANNRRHAGQGETLLRKIAGVRDDAPRGAARRSLAAVHQDGDNNNGFPLQDSCIDDHVHEYLNTQAVRDALHVRPDAPAWYMCTVRSELEYKDSDVFNSIIETHKRIIASGLVRTLIFSGDVDGIVPTAGSRNWVASLGLATTKPWQPWTALSSDHFGTQVGGYFRTYDQGTGESLTLASVRGAGHMASYTQPGRAYALFFDWLAKKLQ